MLEKKELLTLFDITPIEFNDRETGAKVKKYKYSFFDQNNKLVVGYRDDEKYQERVFDVSSFVPEKSFEYSFKGTIFNNVLTWRLLV